MGIVFCQNSFIGELFWHSRIYGYDFSEILQIYGYTFEKFLRIYGYTFEKFLRIYGWYFYDLNGTTPYLGNSNYPPPPGPYLRKRQLSSEKSSINPLNLDITGKKVDCTFRSDAILSCPEETRLKVGCAETPPISRLSK